MPLRVNGERIDPSRPAQELLRLCPELENSVTSWKRAIPFHSFMEVGPPPALCEQRSSFTQHLLEANWQNSSACWEKLRALISTYYVGLQVSLSHRSLRGRSMLPLPLSSISHTTVQTFREYK